MLYQNLVQRQQLKIHPQHLQMLHLYHLNTIELEQRIQNELEENPLIEQATEESSEKEEVGESEEDYKDWEEYELDDAADYNFLNQQQFTRHDMVVNTSFMNDFRLEAIHQLHLLELAPLDKQLGEFIIHSLSDEGFLEASAESVADDFSLKHLEIVEVEKVQHVIDIIRTFEPVGLAAGSIRECLILQLERMNTKRPDVRIALAILRDMYDDLKERKFPKICEALNIDEEEIRVILDLLSRLKLKPIPKGDNDSVKQDTIIPDFVVTLQDDSLQVALFKEKSSSLKINNSWKARVNRMGKSGQDQATSRYLTNKLNAAEWFVNAIKQRESTMLRVMKAIVKMQNDYFMTGDELQLKPMILKDIADKVGVDISTVSRITSNKYVQVSSNCILIKDLFNEGIANQDGEIISVRRVQEAIQQVIMRENKEAPYSDQQIASMLAEKGLKIARRTVTKYRNEIQIPAAQVRSGALSQRTEAA